MNKDYGSGIRFVICTYVALCLFLTAIGAVVDPVGTMEALEFIPWISWLSEPLWYFVHVFGNLLMASVALLFAFRNLSK